MYYYFNKIRGYIVADDVLNLRIPKDYTDLKKDLQGFATQQGRSLNNYIMVTLIKHVEKKKGKKKKSRK